MAVVLPNCELTVGVRAHSFDRDERGAPVAPAELDDRRGPYPGSAVRTDDGSWRLRIDPRCWELRADDEASDGVRTWVLSNVQIHAVPGHPDVDFISATGSTLDPPQVP